MYGQFSALSEVWHAAAKAHGYKILSLVLRVSVMPKCRVYVRALWKFHPMRVGEVVCEKAAGEEMVMEALRGNVKSLGKVYAVITDRYE